MTPGRLADPVPLLRFHREGMGRFSRVIDGNPDYDDLMGYRLDGSEWAVFGNRVDVAEKRRAALALFDGKLRRGTLKLIRPAVHGVCCEGSTSNNLREFAFFERLCRGSRITLFNYADCAHRTVSGSDGLLDAASRVLIDDAREFYEARSDVSASIAHQQILYSRSLLAFALAFAAPDAVRPAALVQANDHSPVRVALSMVMKALGVPRVYLQHAEVTEHFPELDFEYSVLRNRQSLKTYESIGPVRGRVFVIPRQEDPFVPERLAQVRGDHVPVVIYPTTRVLVPQLQTVVKTLHANPSVGSVSIKPHPGAPALDPQAFAPLDVPILAAMPKHDHVAVVANSAVAIELLHRGIPVYQCFAFDPIAPDYYGFVRTGLTKQVFPEDLARTFWTPYDLSERWLATYADWDSTVDGGYVEEKATFVAEMVRLTRAAEASVPPDARRVTKAPFRSRFRRRVRDLASRVIRANPALSLRVGTAVLARAGRLAGSLPERLESAARFLAAHTAGVRASDRWKDVKLPGTDWAPRDGDQRTELFTLVEHTLCSVRDPGEWMQLNDRAGAIPAATVITVLRGMFQDRSPALSTVFDGITRWPSGSASGTWAYLKKVTWGNLEIDDGELGEIARFVYGYAGPRRVRSALEHSLLLALLRVGTGDDLDDFFRNATAVTKSRLSVNQRIQLVRKLRATPGREEEARQTLTEFEAQASAFGKLKFRTMDALEGRSTSDWNHRHAETEFVASAPAGLSGDFAAHVQPVYDTLRSRMRFMDVRTDASAAQALVALIGDALTSRRPFSVIRLSDGEGYLFPEGPFFDRADSANRERHWWGIELDAGRRARIVDEAQRAVATADVVGIPTVYRFIRDHGDRSSSLAQTVQGRGLLQVLQGVPAVMSSAALITEDKVNVSLFSDVDTIASLAACARKVVIASSVREERLPERIRALHGLRTIALPTHARTSLNGNYTVGSEALPFAYPALLGTLEAVVGPGDLVLVAGGIIGKIFVGRARDRGAVAVDVGSVVDDWVARGLPTLR